MVEAVLARGEGAVSIRRELNSRRGDMHASMCRRLVKARVTGELQPDTNPADFARYVVTVVCGISVQAAGGASCKKLRG